MSAPKLCLDKSHWTHVKFGDVTFEPKENIRDARAEGIRHVVGLEHIDSEDIHLRRSQSIDESTTFTKKFSEGDVLFGRRRAYLKKAAQAPFAGICSGDITVMRAKQNLRPELLPFIVNNDKFFDWAVTHSAGGLSPRCKFKDLANYEFLLPPKEQQAAIAELLWAMDEVIQKGSQQIGNLEGLKESAMQDMFSKGIGDTKLKDSPIGQIPERWEASTMSSLISSMKSGLSRRIVSEDIGVPVLISGNIQDGLLDTSDLKYWYIDDPKGAKVANYILNDGDILLCFINSLSQIGKNCIFRDIGRDSIYTTNLFRIVPLSDTSSSFLYYLLNSARVQKRIEQITKPAVNQASFTKEDFLKIKISIPPIDQQQKITTRLERIDLTMQVAKSKHHASKCLQKSLINQVF